MKRLNKEIAQEIIGVTNDTHIGDFIRKFNCDIVDTDDVIAKLVRNGYIAEAGAGYIVTAKAL
jgi:hypothetical protein